MPKKKVGIKKLWIVASAVMFLAAAAFSREAAALETAAAPQDKPVFGLKIRAGGRFDNVRMCIASPQGTKGGPAADISVFAEVPLADTIGLDIDLPVFRPILFGAAFKMLQFEPSVTLKFRVPGKGRLDGIFGPMLGVSLHYGPDYNSPRAKDERTDSFFAMGPMLGGYAGMDFKKPGSKYNFQLGLTPYVIPMFGINDPADHKGVVVGGLLDFQFRFQSLKK
jgi:hypothetical protein